MFRKYHYIPAVLFFVSITSAQGFYPYQANKHEFTFKISPSLPDFVFSFSLFDTSNNHIGGSRIYIRRANSHRIIQTIITDVRVIYFQVNDMNFDGYLDLLLAVGPQGSGGAGYDVWLYAPKAGKFKYDAQFDDLTEPTPDPKTHTITSFHQNGKDSGSRRIFRFESGELIPILLEEDQYDRTIGKVIRTTTEYHGVAGPVVRVDTVTHDN